MITYIANMDQSYMKKPTQISMSLTHAGVIRAYSGWRFKSRFLDQYELLFVSQGTLYIDIQGKKFELGVNQLLICPPYQKLSSYRPSENRVHFYWADYRIETKGDYLLTPFMHTVSNALQVEQWMNAMCEICWQKQNNMYVGDAVLLQLLDSVYQERANSRQISLIRKIQTYVDENMHNLPTVSSVADALGYASDHLSRVFKAHSGISLQEYIFRRRLDVAKTLLTSSSFSINEIAKYLGYEDPNLFTKFFAYHEGISPLHYRNTHL